MLAAHIRDISRGMKAMRKSGLNNKALTLLIQASIPGQSPHYKVAPIKTITAVLDAIEQLEAEYTIPA